MVDGGPVERERFVLQPWDIGSHCFAVCFVDETPKAFSDVFETGCVGAVAVGRRAVDPHGQRDLEGVFLVGIFVIARHSRARPVFLRDRDPERMLVLDRFLKFYDALAARRHRGYHV